MVHRNHANRDTVNAYPRRAAGSELQAIIIVAAIMAIIATHICSKEECLNRDILLFPFSL